MILWLVFNLEIPAYRKISKAQICDRAIALRELLSPCRLCPHECGVNRIAGEKGRCGLGNGMVVACAVPHFGEEPEISGKNGCGAIFFGGCNLACCYCQNYQISQSKEIRKAQPSTPDDLAQKMIDLAKRACHNIAWVTPSHIVPYAVEGLILAGEGGLNLPIVYNTSSYDGLETLKLLDGIVDVYLADLRYGDNEVAFQLSKAEGYVEVARDAIREMARQVGTENIIGEDCTIRRGLIVRVLVLPNDLGNVRESLAFLRSELGPNVRISLMAQYNPMFKAEKNVLLSRRIYYGEYARAIEIAEKLGLENVLIQELDSSEFYLPDFNQKEEPFVDAKQFKR